MASFIQTTDIEGFMVEGNYISFDGLKVSVENIDHISTEECRCLELLFKQAAEYKERKEEKKKREKNSFENLAEHLNAK